MLALKLSLQLLIYMIVGVAVYRMKIVDEHFDKSLTSFILKITLPCLIINSFNIPFSEAQLKNCGILFIAAILYLILCFAIGQIAFKLSGGGHSGRILRFGSIFTNFSFMGIPVVEELYGQTGLLYFVVFLVPIRMVYYSSAKPLLSPKDTQQVKETFSQRLKGWFSPPVVAVFIGFALYITGLELPTFLQKSISSLGSTCGPMGMVLCGITLAKNDIRELLNPRYLKMPFLRNILMPALTLAIMMLVPLDPFLEKIIAIYSTLPVASLLAAFTIQYDPRPEARLEGAGSVFYSLLASSVTIPLWAVIIEKVL